MAEEISAGAEQIAAPPQRAGISLRVLVVGGGIAGIATAFAMQRAGHTVTVLERSPAPTITSDSDGGIRSPPNMTRILNHWGLAPQLALTAVKCPQFRFHAADGELLSIVQLHDDFLRDLMADFVFIRHGDLHTILRTRAEEEGVEVRYGARVVGVDSVSMSVELEGEEERVYADLVVGADGPESIVRRVMCESQPPAPGVRDGHMSLTCTIPTELMQGDDDLRPLCEDASWWVWLGPNTLFHGSLIANRTLFSIVIGLHGVPLEQLAPYADASAAWGAHTYPIEHFAWLDWSVYDVRVQKLLPFMRAVTPTVHVRHPVLDSSVCELARVVIVGEAAHPLMPAGQHNTGVSIEDAETLAALFSRIHTRAQIPRMLAAYEEIRVPRTSNAQDWELRKRTMLALSPGAEQKARDARLRRVMAYGDWAHMDEERFRVMWGDEMEMFSYFSTEKVEDWWTKWGALLERGDDDEWECGCDDEDEGACPHGDEEGGGNRSADGHGKEGSGNWRRRRRVRGPVSPSVEVNVSNGPSQTILSVR